MTKLTAAFANWQQKSHQALIPYITAGHPHPDWTVPIMHALVEGGADVIELGVPFTDPVADGPVIEAAHQQAVKHGVNMTRVLSIVREFREQNNETPIVLMSYLNPIEIMGYDAFSTAAAKAGVDAVLLVDAPIEEAVGLRQMLQANDIANILLATPTTSDARLQSMRSLQSGFLYYVSLKGVTGSATIDVDDVKQNLQRLREHCDLPICVGFGIRDAKAVSTMSAISDGVIVGTALVARLAKTESEGQAEQVARDFMRELRGNSEKR